jgi:cell division protein FtsW (lipid II flippase)
LLIKPSNLPIQGRLLALAALFLTLYSAALTVSPAVRARSFSEPLLWGHWIGWACWILVFGIAHFVSFRSLPEHDPYLLPITGLLSGWGLLTIWRIYPYFGLRQAGWLAVSGLVLILGLKFLPDLRLLRKYKYLWLTGGLVLTAATFLFGSNPSGAAGPDLWLGCCGVYLQPSEPLKLLLIIYLASYLADRPVISTGLPVKLPQIMNVSLVAWLAPTLLMTGLALGLLVMQRDLGTASIFVFLYAVIVYLASGQRKILVAAFIGLVAAGISGYLLFDVVRLRIDAWLNPWLDPSGRSFQIVQSLIAIANGELLGRGPGMGSPILVPISHSDFIFSAITEEMGFLGVVSLALLISIFCARGIRIALDAGGVFRRYLAAGLTAFITAQSLLIIGGNLRLLPLTGVTLPFVSYGGSSLMVSFISVLIFLIISQPGPDPVPRLRKPLPYLALSASLFMGVMAVVLLSGWWAFVRGQVLLDRTDNARRTIADRYVRRGSFVDRHGTPIASSEGAPGSYLRTIYEPSLSNIIGYTHPVYGQSGLEAALDPYLRGIKGNPARQIAWNNLLFGQPPPGLDIRLTLDLDLQSAIDKLLDHNQGAMVLLNAENGEVLSMVSNPGFDANALDDIWDEIIQDPYMPLINRASQGAYAPPETLLAYLTENISAIRAASTSGSLDGEQQASGGSMIQVSPEEMARIAASLSNGGILPLASLAMAVDTPVAGWILIPPGDEGKTSRIAGQSTRAIVEPYQIDGTNFWGTVSTVSNGPEQTITWFVGGTMPGAQTQASGQPLAVALLLEQDNPDLAAQIGLKILERATQQSTEN